MDSFIDFPASLFYDVGGKGAAYEDFDLIYGGQPIANESVSSDDVFKRAKIVELMDTGCDAFPPESNGTHRVLCQRGEGNGSDVKFCLSNESCPIEVDSRNVFDILRNGEKLGTAPPRRRRMADEKVSKSMEKRVEKNSRDSNDGDNRFATNSIGHSERIIKTCNLSAIPRLVKMDDKRRNGPNDERGSRCFRFGKIRNLEGSKLPVWQGSKRDETSGRASIKMKQRPSDDRTDRPFNGRDSIEINSENNDNNSVKVEQMGQSKEMESLMDEKIGKEMETRREEEATGQKDVSTAEYRDKLKETATSLSLKKVEEEWNKNDDEVDDESASYMWSEKYEKAFAKGHSIGAKILRMARATRDERKRLFREYGFENYNRNPRKMPQEILDIGLSLVEKYFEKDDIDAEQRVDDYSTASNESDHFFSTLFSSRLIRR